MLTSQFRVRQIVTNFFESDYVRGRRAGLIEGQKQMQDRAVRLLAAYAATYPGGNSVTCDELWGAVMKLREMEIEVV